MNFEKERDLAERKFGEPVTKVWFDKFNFYEFMPNSLFKEYLKIETSIYSKGQGYCFENEYFDPFVNKIFTDREIDPEYVIKYGYTLNLNHAWINKHLDALEELWGIVKTIHFDNLLVLKRGLLIAIQTLKIIVESQPLEDKQLERIKLLTENFCNCKENIFAEKEKFFEEELKLIKKGLINNDLFNLEVKSSELARREFFFKNCGKYIYNLGESLNFSLHSLHSEEKRINKNYYKRSFFKIRKKALLQDKLACWSLGLKDIKLSKEETEILLKERIFYKL